MHKWCKVNNFTILMSTKKSMLKSCKKMCLLSPLYLSSWMKKDNFKKGTQFRKVLSKGNISTSSFKIYFDFMFNEIKNIWSAHFTLPVPLHSLTDTDLCCIPPPHRLLIYWDEKKKSSRIPPPLLLSPDRADMDCGIDRLYKEEGVSLGCTVYTPCTLGWVDFGY